MVSALISRIVILIFGTLYPAYASYKAVRTKNVKEYVKWMMYWIVFALFTTFETFSDCLLSWLPFYYEIKIVFVLWLLSPVTKGSSFLYRKFVHPQLTKREKEIDEYILHAKDAGYSTVLRLGSRGISYATNVIVKTAIQGQSRLVNHIRRSYSMSDLSDDYVDQPRSRDRSGSIPESEDELDSTQSYNNRLIEDNKELESRKKDHDPHYVPEDKEDLASTRQIYHTNSASSRLRTGLYSVPEESSPSSSSLTKPYTLGSYSSRYSSTTGYDLRNLTKKEQSQANTYGTLPRNRLGRGSKGGKKAAL